MARVRHPPEIVVAALDDVAAGHPRATVAEWWGIDPETLRTWLRGAVPRHARLLRTGGLCERCGAERHDLADGHAYAYLLGMYLGDGCLAQRPRTWNLRIALDVAHPRVVEEVRHAIAAVRGRPPWTEDRSDRGHVVVVSAWNAWACVLPQHGAGLKHDRSILLEDWQREIVEVHAGAFLRGLIHSDGWRGVNTVRSKGRIYTYPRYQFSNRSDDIRELFCWACDVLGVGWRPWGPWNISVARRDDVALLDLHVGPKR